MSLCLECFEGTNRTPRRVDLKDFPAKVGRLPNCDLVLSDSQASRVHAEITLHNGDFILTDLGSTNGTFVNRERITSATIISNGDVLHFAQQEFLVRTSEKTPTEFFGDQTMVGSSTLPSNFPTQAREFGELLSKRLVCGFRQVITTSSGEFYGYELLGRGTHPTIGTSPYEMFKLADAMEMEVELSELLRERSFEQAEAAGITAPLFFNSHPKESHNPDRLLRGLHHLTEKHPSLNLVFEVHEGAVTDLKMMADLKTALREMNIRLAYDDFGSGQARLQELVEVPPDMLKFDIGLVANIAPDTPKYRLLASLNNLVKDMGIPTLAEGIETAEVAEACREIGIDYFQGYFFGRPEPIPPADSQ